MRLIDADEYIEKLRDRIGIEPTWNLSGLRIAIFELHNMPTIDKVRWIPVSEAMPEESDGTVLVCMPSKSPYNQKEPFVNAKHNRQVETATYSQHSDTWHFKNGGVSPVRPIAWMPLPEPWKGEEDETDS